MGKTYRQLKNKIEQLRFENGFLTSKVEKVILENGRVKRELQVSNARIVELAQELEDTQGKNRELRKQVKELQSELVEYANLTNRLISDSEKGQALLARELGLSFIDDVKEASKDNIPEWNANTTYHGITEVMYNGSRAFVLGIGEEPVTNDDIIRNATQCGKTYSQVEWVKENIYQAKEKKAFSSRFMPNVIFSTRGYEDEFIKYALNGIPIDCFEWYSTDSNGNLFGGSNDEHFFDNFKPILNLKNVSIIVAIPSLVPASVVYDKESDSLVKKVCVNQICQGEYCGCDDSHSFKKS